MASISYLQMVVFVSIAWLVVRIVCAVKNKQVNLKREAELLLVYVCIIVVIRFTFCPFGRVDGRIQPLLFDKDKIFPLWINFEPFIHLFDYQSKSDAILNLIGNVAMFVPLGVIWPSVFKKLDTPLKTVAAGLCASLTIEVLQLPFFDRASDVDDLILNTAGFIIGYGIFALARRLKKGAK